MQGRRSGRWSGAGLAMRPTTLGARCPGVAAEHGLPAGAKDLVGKFAAAGDARQHQGPRHGRQRRDRLLARDLARQFGHLIGHQPSLDALLT